MSNIIVRGAREGNLKDISLEIPRDKLIVFTGLSGSGKSTLAIDVIFQECQRQYLEAMGLQANLRVFFQHFGGECQIRAVTQND